MDSTTSLWTLFVSSLLAATVLPGGSEAVLFAVLYASPELAWRAVAIATAGNTLGGLSSYVLGRLLPTPKPLRGTSILQRYGAPALLLSWVPIIGDALCVAAGWLRLNAAWAIVYIAVGKLARYAAIAVVTT
jgi:membrane protein YqaA with SNARE-associated domain